jgi:virginiamycin A acetyltransferase
MNFEQINSQIDETASVYIGARIQDSTIGKNCSVGNFSRVYNSDLYEFSRLERNNHVFNSSLNRYTYTGMNTVILHTQIGSFCSISWNVSIGGANHDYTRITQHSFLYNNHDGIRPINDNVAYNRFSEPLRIGNDVWIGAGAVINRGITVGDGAVIGANAVVTKDVEPYSIVGGVPARVINYRFSAEVIDLLKKLNWWDWPIEKIQSNYKMLSDKPAVEEIQHLLNI